MKKVIFSVLALILILIVLEANVTAQAPLEVNYQGRVLNAAGFPVADGIHTFSFRLYSAASGGIKRWEALNIDLPTTNGLFSYALGSDSSSLFAPDLFVKNSPLYLEIEVDAEIQTPRIKVISSAYAETAGNLNAKSPTGVGSAWKTDPTKHQFSIYGTDGIEQLRLGGRYWGEILLYDSQVVNRNTVALSANANEGGQLQLLDRSQVVTIDMHGGRGGDTAVIFPVDAISASEIWDEPSVANEVRPLLSFQLGSIGDHVLDSVTINAPRSGYVEITGTCYMNLWHINGTDTRVFVGISEDGSISNASPGAQTGGIPAVLPTGVYQMPCATTRLFSVTAGLKKFYMVAERNSGTDNATNVSQISMLAKYYPTAAGNIVTAPPNANKTAMSIPSDGSVQYENPYLQIQTLEEINARLTAELEEMKAHMEWLSQQKTDQSASSE